MDIDIDPSTLPNELALSVAEKCQKWTYAAYSGEHEINNVPRNPTVDRQYDTRMERAIADTQTKVQSQKRVLDDKKLQDEEEKQQASIRNLSPEAKVAHPLFKTELQRLHDLATQLVQLQAMTKAQSYLLHMVSQIPSSESPLNALLARENVESINEQTVQTIRDVKRNIADLDARIYREKALLEETMEISTALKERLASLRTKSQQLSSQYLAELSHQKTKLTTQTRTLTGGVRQFIQDHLAKILYAESQGAMPGDPESLPKSKRRQDENDESPEKEIAGRMITLVEELMNRLVGPNGMSQWVDVPEDDVIVRCLVRANIALMHPNDASKIKLVEFHKDVDSDEMET